MLSLPRRHSRRRVKLFLDNAARLCSCSVHVRRPQAPHSNHGARSAPGRRRHAPPPRPRPQPRSQTDRLRQATRRTVQQRAGTPGFAFLARPFGTADIAVILARITCGLRRAAMLEAKLCKRAERGRDLTVAPIRLPAIRVPGAARPVAPPDVQPADPARTRASPASPPRKKSPRRCVAARSAPSSSISAAISASRPADLDRAFWDEINHAIMMYGGSLVRFFNDLQERLWALRPRRPLRQADPGWPEPPPRLPVPATGPP